MKIKGIILILVLLFTLNGVDAQQGKKQQHAKFVYATSIGFSSGIGTLQYETHHLKNELPFFKIQQLLAYQFNNYVTAGLGGGIDIWQKTAFIPLYGSLHVNFIDRRLVPFWFMNAGYAFKWYGSQLPDPTYRVIHGATTGLHGETGLGLKINMNEKMAFMFSVNYTVQQSTIKYSTNGTDDTFSRLYTNASKDLFYHFLGVKVGILY